MASRKDAIIKGLEAVYRNRPFNIISCARLLDESWDRLASEDPAWSQGLEHEVHMFIWNFFPGGTTAQRAAERVIAEVEALNDKSDS